MAKVSFKPGNMLYPLPAVLVSVRDASGEDNLITVAWVGTVCTNPPMLSISVRPERHSYRMLKESGQFVVNLTTKTMAKATDYCGVRSGRDVNKFKETGLTKGEASAVNAPVVMESPVNIECKVKDILELGSHHMFLADVVHVTVDDRYMDEKGTFRIEQSDPIVYSHGTYFDLGESLGTFGYSVRNPKKTTKKPKNNGKILKKSGKKKKV